jgi:hypothetical protein
MPNLTVAVVKAGDLLQGLLSLAIVRERVEFPTLGLEKKTPRLDNSDGSYHR